MLHALCTHALASHTETAAYACSKKHPVVTGSAGDKCSTHLDDVGAGAKAVALAAQLKGHIWQRLQAGITASAGEHVGVVLPQKLHVGDGLRIDHAVTDMWPSSVCQQRAAVAGWVLRDRLHDIRIDSMIQAD